MGYHSGILLLVDKKDGESLEDLCKRILKENAVDIEYENNNFLTYAEMLEKAIPKYVVVENDLYRVAIDQYRKNSVVKEGKIILYSVAGNEKLNIGELLKKREDPYIHRLMNPHELKSIQEIRDSLNNIIAKQRLLKLRESYGKEYE